MVFASLKPKTRGQSDQKRSSYHNKYPIFSKTLTAFKLTFYLWTALCWSILHCCIVKNTQVLTRRDSHTVNNRRHVRSSFDQNEESTDVCSFYFDHVLFTTKRHMITVWKQDFTSSSNVSKCNKIPLPANTGRTSKIQLQVLNISACLDSDCIPYIWRFAKFCSINHRAHDVGPYSRTLRD